MNRTHRSRALKARLRNFSKTRLSAFQIFSTIALSAISCFIAYQTLILNRSTQENNAQLKILEAKLSGTRFEFERMRDVYDRVVDYLSSEEQSVQHGRIIVILISMLPQSDTRTQLRNLVMSGAEKDAVVKGAADTISQPITNSDFAEVNGYYGNFDVDFDSNTYTVRTISPFGFLDSAGVKWSVPTGFVSDGASIPRILWSTFGSPLNSEFIRASVIQDYYVTQRTRSPDDVNRMFYEALIADGVSPAKARTMSTAVSIAGPRWEVLE
jgi:hypothetical protein